MKTVFVLLLLFMCIGLFVRAYNAWTRFLLIGTIAAMILYVTLK